MNFLIEHQCPQCGAPAVLEESDRLFTCEFCRVKSYLHCRKYFRYMLPSKAPADKELVFFPYWRFKGMGFACAASGIKDKILDLSRQAVETPWFPFSLGFRSQVLKLKFAMPETQGYFIKPDVSLEHVKELVGGWCKSTMSDPVIHKTFIGETISLIYSPVYVGGKLYDAVLNEPFRTRPPQGLNIDDLDIKSFPGDRPDWRIEFIPSQCPSCGWDVDGDRDSLIVHCRNCNSLWRPSKDKFKKIKFSYIPGGKENVAYFPFWKIRADISGIGLNTYADLVNVANLPKVVSGKRKDDAFFFWAPAIKIRPHIFLNLSRCLTLAQPGEDRPRELPPEAFLYPVTLSAKEAVDSLKMSLANFMKPKENIPETLPQITIEPKELMLVYVPFTEGHHEYVHSDYHIAIHKNLIQTAKNL